MMMKLQKKARLGNGSGKVVKCGDSEQDIPHQQSPDRSGKMQTTFRERDATTDWLRRVPELALRWNRL